MSLFCGTWWDGWSGCGIGIGAFFFASFRDFSTEEAAEADEADFSFSLAFFAFFSFFFFSLFSFSFSLFSCLELCFLVDFPWPLGGLGEPW